MNLLNDKYGDGNLLFLLRISGLSISARLGLHGDRTVLSYDRGSMRLRCCLKSEILLGGSHLSVI